MQFKKNALRLKKTLDKAVCSLYILTHEGKGVFGYTVPEAAFSLFSGKINNYKAKASLSVLLLLKTPFFMKRRKENVIR